jgi:hypothetical protein
MSIRGDHYRCVRDGQKKKKNFLAHREGRTRSLQITQLCVLHACCKSLTLYPIELGGHIVFCNMNIYDLEVPIRCFGACRSHPKNSRVLCVTIFVCNTGDRPPVTSSPARCQMALSGTFPCGAQIHEAGPCSRALSRGFFPFFSPILSLSPSLLHTLTTHRLDVILFSLGYSFCCRPHPIFRGSRHR